MDYENALDEVIKSKNSGDSDHLLELRKVSRDSKGSIIYKRSASSANQVFSDQDSPNKS